MDESACVQVINKVRSYRVNKKQITKIAVEICERLSVHHYEVCIQFIGPKSMRQLNKKFRHKDKSTDVLSFPQYTWKRGLKAETGTITSVKRSVMNPMPLGDVVISLDDAAKNASESSHGLDQELCFLMVHGILHLVGHDHMKPTDKKKMFAEQRKLMNCFKASNKKPALWSRCVTKIKKGR